MYSPQDLASLARHRFRVCTNVQDCTNVEEWLSREIEGYASAKNKKLEEKLNEIWKIQERLRLSMWSLMFEN